jgi:tetratricopeptide (TPR) repeat protein
MVLFALNRNQEAVAAFTTALGLNPESPLFYFARGQIYRYHLNQPDKARADFEAGCRLDHPLCCRELEKMTQQPTSP